MQGATVISFLNPILRDCGSVQVVLELPKDWGNSISHKNRPLLKPIIDSHSSEIGFYIWDKSYSENSSALEYPLIIVATTPDAFICNSIDLFSVNQSLDNSSIDVLVQQWQHLAQQACRTVLHFPDKCLLLLDDGVRISQQAINVCKENGVAIKESESLNMEDYCAVAEIQEDLSNLMRHNLLQDDSTFASWEELIALSQWQHSNIHGDGIDNTNFNVAAFNAYRTIRSKEQIVIELDQKYYESKSQLTEVESKNCQMSDQIIELRNEVAVQQGTSTEIRAKNEMQAMQIQQLQEELSRIAIQNEKLRAENRDHANESKQIRDTLVKNKQQVDSLKKQVGSLNSELAVVRETSSGSESLNVNELAALKAENEMQVMQIIQLQQELRNSKRTPNVIPTDTSSKRASSNHGDANLSLKLLERILQ